MNYNTYLPPFKWFVLENFPYIEDDFDALTNWQLFCKLGKEMNRIIEKCNLTGEQVEQLTNAFNSLKAYVDNYFENLDVQDEIDNKLDEMAESGELAEIIAQFVELAGVLSYDTKNAMKEADNLFEGSVCKTLGNTNYADGQGAFYRVREVLTTDVIDNNHIVALLDPELVAEKIKDYSIICFDTISSLKSANNLMNGSFVRTYGKTSFDDKLGQFYKVRTKEESEIADDVILIELQDSNLIAELVPSEEINIKYFGAIGDGETDDILAIKKAIEYAKEKNVVNIFIPKGTYLITDQFKLSSNMNLYGEGNSSIIKASDFNSSNDYKSMIIFEKMYMHDNGDNTSNVTINHLKLDNNQEDNAGQNGLIQLRGQRNCIIQNCDFVVNGNNCWGIQVFSANQNIKLDNLKIDNISADNSLGGCLWVRSGMANINEGTKTKNVFITNCSMTSTAKDELFCIADGVSGGWTECEVSNIRLEGKASTNLPGFLFVANNVGNDSYLRYTMDNVVIIGKCTNFALKSSNASGVTGSPIEYVVNNVVIDMEKGGGISAGWSSDLFYFSNCKIKIAEVGKKACQGANLINSWADSTCEACNIRNCTIDCSGNSKIPCEQCNLVANSIIKSTTRGLHSYGSHRAIYSNNIIYANTYAISFQNNGSNGGYDSIIMGNYIQRLTNDSNSGTVAMFCQNIKNSRSLANHYLLHSTAGDSYGFQYYDNTTGASNYTRDDNYTNV